MLHPNQSSVMPANSKREILPMTANIIHVDNALNNLVTTHRENLRGIAEKADSLVPELLERGRAPTGNFPPMQSLGFVELDRGEEDLRPLVSQLLSSILDVVTDEECQAGFTTYGEPIGVGVLLDRLDWCVTTDPLAQSRFPDWGVQDDLHRLEAVFDFVSTTLRDYHLRLLEVADTEEPVPDELGLPAYDGVIDDLRLFGAILTVNDKELEITGENAGDIRNWLFDVMGCQGSKLTESQQLHLIEALHRTDGLCPVSMAKWIP